MNVLYVLHVSSLDNYVAEVQRQKNQEKQEKWVTNAMCVRNVDRYSNVRHAAGSTHLILQLAF